MSMGEKSGADAMRYIKFLPAHEGPWFLPGLCGYRREAIDTLAVHNLLTSLLAAVIARYLTQLGIVANAMPSGLVGIAAGANSSKLLPE